jgi:uroporphyrin-III C-methyltransferase
LIKWVALGCKEKQQNGTMSELERRAGKVYLVGAGPGDPELMTVKGQRLIRSCDALVYDYLVSEVLLDWARPGCEQHNVGKRAGFHSMAQELIEQLLVRLAGEGKMVVRLKGGDPFIFGRGGEEAEALRRAGVAYEVVPAVTAALGCAAYCGIPLTHRNWSSAVTFISGHEQVNKGGSMVDWAQHARSGATLVLYMAMGRLEQILAELARHGRSGAHAGGGDSVGNDAAAALGERSAGRHRGAQPGRRAGLTGSGDHRRCGGFGAGSTVVRSVNLTKKPGGDEPSGWGKSCLARRQALVTLPALSALADTQMRLTCPLGMRTRTRCTLGLNTRLVTFAMWVPIPPLFLVRPLR